MTEDVSPLAVLTTPIDVLGAWRLGLFFGTFACSLLLLRHYRRLIGWEPTLLWVWLLSGCLYVVEFPLVPYGDYNTAFMATAGQTLCEALLVPIAVLAAPQWVWRFVTAYMWVSIAVVLTGHSMLTPWDFPSPSFDTALIALYLPFAGTWLRCASIVAIALTHGSTALTVILAELLALSLSSRLARIGLAAAAPLALGIATLHSHSPWFDSSTRIAFWKKYMSFWAYGSVTKPPSGAINWRFVILGLGPGSFVWLAAILDKWKDSNMAMHNEPLMIAFELGLTGLSLAVATYLRALCRAWKRPRIRAGLFGFLAFSLTYHPLRYFPTMFLVALIFREALLGISAANTIEGYE